MPFKILNDYQFQNTVLTNLSSESVANTAMMQGFLHLQARDSTVVKVLALHTADPSGSPALSTTRSSLNTESKHSPM